MSEFSPSHWAIFAVIVAAILYGVFHAIRGVIRFKMWRRERTERSSRKP